MRPADPSPEELAAIVAAVEIAWPRPVVHVPQEPERASAWRFSGRWWSKPTPVRRDRPWLNRAR
ncbi:MAG TPA: hypothetical protein VFZ97_00750 [Acidimicrobiales bacterium]